VFPHQCALFFSVTDEPRSSINNVCYFLFVLKAYIDESCILQCDTTSNSETSMVICVYTYLTFEYVNTYRKLYERYILKNRCNECRIMKVSNIQFMKLLKTHI